MSRTESYSLLPSEASRVSPIPKEDASDSESTCIHILTLKCGSMSIYSFTMDVMTTLWSVGRYSKGLPRERSISEPTFQMLMVPSQSSPDSDPASFLFPTPVTGKIQPKPITLQTSSDERVAQFTGTSDRSAGALGSDSGALGLSSDTGRPNSRGPETRPASNLMIVTRTPPGPQLSPLSSNPSGYQKPTSINTTITTSKLTVTPIVILSPSTISPSPTTRTLSQPFSTFSSSTQASSRSSLTSVITSTEHTSLPIILQTSVPPISSILTFSATPSSVSDVLTNTSTLSSRPVTTSSPIETESTSSSTNISSTLVSDSSGMSLSALPSEITETTSVSMTMSTPPFSTLPDPPSSTIVITGSSTSSSSNIGLSIKTSAFPTSSDTSILPSSPSEVTATTDYGSILSITSEALPTGPAVPSIPPATSSSSSAIMTGSYSPTLTMVISLPSTISQELPRVSEGAFTSSYFTTEYWSSTLIGGGITTFSTVIETGVLSTNKPGDGKGFSHNTAAIIGVALAGTFSLIMTVIIVFFACRKYKKRRGQLQENNSEARGFSRNSWHSPLEGDDDGSYLEYRRPVLTSLVPNTGYMGPQEGTSSAPGAKTTEGILYPLMSNLEQGDICEAIGQPILARTRFYETQDIGVPAIPILTSTFARGTNPYEGKPRTSTSKSNTHTSHTHINSYNSNTPMSGSHSAVSLNAGSSIRENATASTSSGHNLLTKMISIETSKVERRPVLHVPHPRKHSRKLESEGTDFRGFFGRLRRDRDSVSAVAIHDRSVTGQFGEHHNRFNPTTHFLSPPSSYLQPGSGQTFPPSPSLNTFQLAEPWPVFTSPPSPIPSESSRTLEGLLTPHLEMWLASSEHSSLASLRDNVDYSRPISGPVRNRVHSNMTFQTEDTTVTFR